MFPSSDMSISAQTIKEKKFEYFSYLPLELQTMMIENMELDDRCRFTRSSKLCNEIVKKSKNYVFGLSIDGDWEKEIDIKVHYSDPNKQPLFGFNLMFEEEEESKRKFMKYLTSDEKELWRMELMQSTDLIKLAFQIFKCLLNTHQNTIRNVSVVGHDLCKNCDNLDLGIKRLNNLKSIQIHDKVGINQFIPKLRHHLEELEVFGNAAEMFHLHSELINQVQGTLMMYGLNLNKEQFLQLSASHIETDIGKLSEQDVFDIISSWQNGTIRKEVLCFKWNVENSDFNVERFINLFGEQYEEHHSYNAIVEIEHNKDAGKIAMLDYNRFGMSFYMED